MICFRFFLAICLSIILSCAPLLSAHAAPLIRISVQLDRQATSTLTGVSIGFTTPSGIDTGGLDADTIEVTFPSGFDISAIDLDDVALTYGPTTGQEATTTLEAVPAAGVWGYAEVGNRLVLTPPTDAVVGTIPAGNRVLLRIGVSAGADRIVTPPTIGIYAIRIEGRFGDSGVGYVQIVASDSLTVSATVADAGGGGSAQGQGQSQSATTTRDVTAPIMSALRADLVSSTSTRIRWTTDELADAYIEYGATTGTYSYQVLTRLDRRLNHDILVGGLMANTPYYFRVRARDAASNTAWSTDQFFQTLPVEPLPPPAALVISRLRVLSVDDQQAVITWTTNVSALGEVQIGATSTGQIFSETLASRTHSVTVTGLVSGTNYSFRAIATTAAGERVVLEGAGFRTLNDRTPPTNVLDFQGVYVTSTRRVELRWVNPPEADLKFVTITRLSGAAGSGERFICQTREGVCTDAPLLGGGSVMYRAVVHDLQGNRSSGVIVTVIVPASAASPARPSVARPSVVPPPAAPVEGELSLPPILRPRPMDTRSVESTTERVFVPTTTDDVVIESASTSTPVTGVTELSQTVPLEEEAFVLSPEFFLSSVVPATPDRGGIRSALTGRSVQVQLPIAGLAVSLSQAQIQIGGGPLYQFAYRESVGAFVSDLSFDRTKGELQRVRIQAVTSGGQAWEGSYLFHVWPAARVMEAGAKSGLGLIAGANIEIIASDSGVTVARIVTDKDGQYSEILPNGRYRLRIQKEGYRTEEQNVRVETGVLLQDIQLRRSVRALSQVWDARAPLQENLRSLGSEALLAGEIGLEAVRQPEVQQVAREVVAPVAVAATVGTTAVAVNGFNLLNYLRFLFTQPLLLIRRRKRQSWGVVYNALSKQPIELAIVRLMKAGTAFALQTRITDAQGRFSFFVTPGSYTIQVQKPGFQFPTVYLKDERLDVDLADLYHGEEIKVTGPVTISPNIPVDPRVKEETPKAILQKRYWRKAQSLLGMGGIFVGFAAVVISPTVFMAGFALLQVASYALFRRLAVPPAPKRWGIVYDAEGKKPLEKTVVRVFDKKFNKLLETQITSKDGTYGFFAAKGHYYLTAEKPGYERYLSADLDLTKAADTYIDYRFELKRAGAVVK